MKKLVATLSIAIFLLCLASEAFAVTYYSWRYRSHATDCTGLTDGKERDLCYEEDADTLYKCEPTAGDCDTAAEWRQIGDPSHISNLVEDTTPQLGGDLDLNGSNIDFPTTANISDVLDEDAMGSDSATALATQQSIKAYVDSLAKEWTLASGVVYPNLTTTDVAFGGTTLTGGSFGHDASAKITYLPFTSASDGRLYWNNTGSTHPITTQLPTNVFAAIYPHGANHGLVVEAITKSTNDAGLYLEGIATLALTSIGHVRIRAGLDDGAGDIQDIADTQWLADFHGGDNVKTIIFGDGGWLYPAETAVYTRQSVGNTGDYQWFGDDTNSGTKQHLFTKNDNNGWSTIYGKSRAAAPGSFAIVQDNDFLHTELFYGDDGVDYDTLIAYRRIVVDDATPAAGAIGGAWEWYTANTSGTTSLGMELNNSNQLDVAGVIKAGSGDVQFVNSAGNLDGSKVADADLGDFTFASGSASLDANTVAESELLESMNFSATGDWDFGSGVFQVPNSTSLPASCEVGDAYMDTDATSGERFYLCESTNTWALQGDGGGGGSDTNSPKEYYWPFAGALAVDAQNLASDGIAPNYYDVDTNLALVGVSFDDTGDTGRFIQFKVPQDATGTVTVGAKGYAATAAADKCRIEWFCYASATAENWDGTLTEVFGTTITNSGTQDVETEGTDTETLANLSWSAGDTVKCWVQRDGDDATNDDLSGDWIGTETFVRIPRA